MKNRISQLLILLLTNFILFSHSPAASGAVMKIRAAHFPNVTHAPALIGRANGAFEKAFENSAEIDWKIFNAGPEAIEALSVGAVDILYVGPNPAVNGFIRSNGATLRVLAGVASGGSAFVIRAASGIQKFEDIKGRRVATPQVGNTQDVALRYLMGQKGLKSKVQGGDVEIFNISGGDQLTAFQKKQVDAIWTVEPWVSRLVSEADGKILLNEKELWPSGSYATTILVVRKKFLDEHPELLQKWVDAHAELTRWINKNRGHAMRLFNEELRRETGKALPPQYLDQSFERITFTDDAMENAVFEAANRAFSVGLLGRKEPKLESLYETLFLTNARAKLGKGAGSA